jgi:branched-subunit amino acid permease
VNPVEEVVMAATVTTSSSAQAAKNARRVRDQIIAGIAVAFALFVLYAVFLDQGALLSPVFGDLARKANYLHEFAHDGRHLLAAPCH